MQQIRERCLCGATDCDACRGPGASSKAAFEDAVEERSTEICDEIWEIVEGSELLKEFFDTTGPHACHCGSKTHWDRLVEWSESKAEDEVESAWEASR